MDRSDVYDCDLVLPPPSNSDGETWNAGLFWYQTEFVFCRERLQLALWGIASGKSLCGCVKLILAMLEHQRLRALHISPTRTMFEANIQPILEELDELWTQRHGFKLITKWHRSGTLWFQTFNGSRCYIFSGEHPQRIRGFTTGYLWFDELASMRLADDVWKRAVGRNRGRGPQTIVVTTTPEGDEGPIRMIRKRRAAQEPGVWISRVKTSDNPTLSQEFLDEQRRSLSKEQYETECEAKIISATGLVYGDFKRETHLIDFTAADLVDGWYAVIVGVDWGISHAHAIFMAVRRSETNPYYPDVVVFDELGLDNSSDEAMIKAVIDRARTWGRGIRFAAPDARKPDACIQLARALRKTGWGTKTIWEFPPELLRVRVGAEYVRRGLMSADNKVSIHFAKSLLTNGLNEDGKTGIIVSMEHYRRKTGQEAGTYKEDPHDDNKHTHSCDALRYGILTARLQGYTMSAEGLSGIRPERGTPVGGDYD